MEIDVVSYVLGSMNIAWYILNYYFNTHQAKVRLVIIYYLIKHLITIISINMVMAQKNYSTPRKYFTLHYLGYTTLA